MATKTLRKKKVAAKTSTSRVGRKRKKDKSSEYFNQMCETPRGILSYPTLHTPTKTNDGKDQWSCDIYVSKEDMKSPRGKKFMSQVEEALEFYDLDIDDLQHFPVVDMDKADGPIAEHEKGMFRIRAKNKLLAPTVIDRKKENMLEEDVIQIKGGDIGKLAVTPYKYVYNGADGLGLGLDVVMFIEEGEPLGGGAQARASAVAAMEVEDIEDEDISDEDEYGEEDDTEFE